MARAKKSSEAKFTAWTVSGMRLEMTGNIPGCAVELFGCVHGKETREKVLKMMQERHEKLNELEAKQENKDEKNS